MSTPNIAAQTLELDSHTRRFFSPADHVGPVEARFKLDVPELVGKTFIGRLAKFCDGSLHLVLQDADAKPQEGGETSCLVSLLAVLRVPEDAGERAKLVATYWARHLDGQSGNTVPFLWDGNVLAGLTRLHFDRKSGLGLEFFAEEGCQLLDLRQEQPLPQALHRPFVEIGDALHACAEMGLELDESFEDAPAENRMLAFVEMEGSTFHSRVEELLGEPEGALYHSVRFHTLDEEERVRDVFGCDYETLERALELLRLSLIIEMGTNEQMSSWESATWHPWAVEAGLGGHGAGGEYLNGEVTESLEWMMDKVGERLGCRMREQVWDDEGIHAFAQKWAFAFQIRVEKPSAHELVEASLRLRTMLGDS